MKSNLSVLQKHELYEASVQNYEHDREFVFNQYQKIRGRKPIILREDFGGTGALACEWVKTVDQGVAYCVDLDDEPMNFGKEKHLSKLSNEERLRMHYLNANVLDDQNFKSDITVAFNFSYLIFKQRQLLLSYFKKVHKHLNDEGLFFLDLFGGTEARQELVEETEHEKHTYYWDCDRYDPLTDNCLYYIHFKTHHDQQKHEKVFEYDWRLWSPADIKDILEEAGFSKIVMYWEGEDEDGAGDGNFEPAQVVTNCESWVIYILAEK